MSNLNNHTMHPQTRQLLSQYLPADPINEIDTQLCALYHRENLSACNTLIGHSLNSPEWSQLTSLDAEVIYEFYPCDYCGELFSQKRTLSFALLRHSHPASCARWKEYTQLVHYDTDVQGGHFLTLTYPPPDHPCIDSE